jgi:hypothetical protein
MKRGGYVIPSRMFAESLFVERGRVDQSSPCAASHARLARVRDN